MKIRTIQYIGGKANLVNFILQNLPAGDIYVEPFGGAGWVLFNKPPHPVEVYNDLDGSLIALFRVIQNPTKFTLLRRKLRYTLFSFDEYRRACRIIREWRAGCYFGTEVQLAWAKYVIHQQGFAGIPDAVIGSWGRVFNKGKNGPLVYHRHVDNHLTKMHKRLKNVQIEQRSALEVIRYWDTPKTVFYLDPPYPMNTRRKKRLYLHEQDDDFHQELVDLLCEVKGAFVLSAYQNPIYERLVDLGIAERLAKTTLATAIGKTRVLMSKVDAAEWADMTRRVEVIYIKRNGGGQARLFS